MTRRQAVLILAVWVGLVAVSVSVARPTETAQGGHVRRSGTTLDERRLEASPRRRGRASSLAGPSHYWRLERKYVAQQHRMGRLGAEVRRLRRESKFRRQKLNSARRLQVHLNDPVAAEAQQVVSGLLCIHGGEGSWTDAGSPYWGGLQMDESFQANYAPPSLRALGTADHWTPLQQLAVGVIGWSLQGHWAPWPRTSRACGLR